MKRILSVVFASALLFQAGVLFAQEASEPSEESVLNAARAKYWGSKDSGDAKTAPSPEQKPELTAKPEASAPQANEPQTIAPQAKAPQENAPAKEEAPEPGEAQARPEVPYTPFILSFVPGVAIPFGLYNTSFAFGWIGVQANDVTGLAGAEIFTLTRDIRGIQGAGVFNMAQRVSGIQGAGVFNIADGEVFGGQGAGVFNIARGTLRGIQGAGLFNIAGDTDLSAQGAGLFNIAGDMHGFQGAGLFNVAGDVQGCQAAPLFNRAKNVKGVQVGLVNVAKNVDGMQLGLINIAENSVDSLGVIYEPYTDYFYAFWQGGLPSLYATLGVGAHANNWSFDYSGAVASAGLGSSTHIFKLKLDADLSAEQVLEDLPFDALASPPHGNYRHGIYSWKGWSMLNPFTALKITASLPIGEHWRIVGGLKADIDLHYFGDNVPESLKGGASWSGTFCGGDFTIYPKWFLGLTI
jgi:hypothetical protein